MNKKEIIIPLLILFLLPLASISVAKAETRLVWRFDWEGMDIEVYAPYQAYPGDTITIRVRVEAKEDLQDVYVRVWLYGSRLEGYAEWNYQFSVLFDVDLSTGVVRDQNFNVQIPSDVSPGLIYSHTYCTWKVYRILWWEDRSRDNSFRVTYLKNKAYEELQVAYSNLWDDYNTLLANYNALNSSYYGLKSSYETLNSTYYDLLDTYDELQSDYNSLQESYNTLDADHNTLQSTYNSLLTNYTNLQGDYDSVCSDYDTLEADYNSMESSYNNLETSYNSLNSTCNELESKHDTLTADLGTTRNLSYILIITTIVFIATTVFFAIRKPRAKPESKAT